MYNLVMIKLKKHNFFCYSCFLFALLFLNFANTFFCFKCNYLKISATSKYITYPYAKVLDNNVYLFKTNTSTFLTNAYFEIPKTYYVLVLNNIDETFYKVEYNGFVGFVLKNKVSVVSGTPQNPYLKNTTFRVYAQDGLNVMSSPFSSCNPQIVVTMPELPTPTYIGKITADELVEGRGNTWYYCTYKQQNSENLQEKVFSGYVYAGFCDNLTSFSDNPENLKENTNAFYDNNQDYLYSLINLSPFLKMVILICVCLPSAILIFLLFSPYKIRKKLKLKKIKQQSIKNQALNKIQKVVEEDDTI